MAERLDLRKEVFNKAQYVKTIDTKFSELGIVSVPETLEASITVDQFFTLYNQLFYDIPALGDTNSHQYLVRTSGEYINFDEIQDEILALQAEIAQLRSDLLQAQMENVRMNAANSGDDSTNEALEVLERELQRANEEVVTTANNLSQDTSTSINATGNEAVANVGGLGSGASGNTGASSGGGGGASGGGGGGGY